MTEIGKAVFEELSKTLYLQIASHPEMLEKVTEVERVRFYEMALIQEKLMAEYRGNSPQNTTYKIPQIHNEWKEL